MTKFGDRNEALPTLIGTGSDSTSFSLEVASRVWIAVALTVLLLILILFWQLAKGTDLICDTNGCFRGDGFRPYSLARGQMNFWFLVVIGASIFLWIAVAQLSTSSIKPASG